ncbi:uncharacterized protein J3R85_003591, partial [Psidium guajava]
VPGEIQVLAQGGGVAQWVAPAQGHGGMWVCEGDWVCITAYVEQGKIKKLTGVKTKELLLWITLSDIYVDDPPTGKITFQTPAGLFRTFPVSAFEVEEEVKDVSKNKEVKEGSAAVGIKEV